MKKQPIKIVRGNDIVLRATCYVRNEIGELEAIDLQGCDVSVSALMLQGGVTDIPYSVVDSNTLELDCKAEVFPVLGSYSIDIRIVKDGQNVRFATRAAVQIVEYSNELYEFGECCDGEYSVVSIPDQIACMGPVKYSLHVGVKNGESNFGEVVDALTERVTDIEEKNAEQDEEIAGFEKQIEDLGEQIAPMLNQLNSALGDVINEVGKQEERIDDISEQIGDITLAGIKNYNTYAEYNADRTRDDRDISFIDQDNSIVVKDKRYSQNAECYVGSDVSGISTTGNWFLAGELTIKQAFDVNVIGSVQRTLGSGACGFFALGVRGNSTGAVINQFQWLCKVGGSVPQLRVVVDGFSVKLYCKVFGGQYANGHIRIYNQCNRYNKDDNKVCFFTLKDSTTIIPETDVPSGTDIADAPYLLKTGTAAQSTKVLQSNSVLSKERRVLLGEDNDNTQQDNVCKSANLTFNPSTKTLTVPLVNGNSASATNSAFMQSLEGLCHKSIDSFLSLQRRTEYICGQQALSDTEEAGKAFFGSSANPLVISVPLKDPGDAVAGGKVNVNLIRYYFTENYWQELFFVVNSPNIYTRWVASGNARPWYRMMKEDSSIEYNAWVANATKLATPRKIGFAYFDGTADLSLNVIQGAFNVRWGTNTTQWQRVIRLKTNTSYNRNTVILAVQDTEAINFSGILKFQARTANTTSAVYTDVKWLALSQRFGDFSKSFRVYVTRPTDTDEYVYIDLYANSAYTYVQMLFNVLSHNVNASVAYGGSGEWVEASAIPGILESTSTYEVLDELNAIKERLAALEAKTTTES